MSDNANICKIDRREADNNTSDKSSEFLCRINRIQFISLFSISLLTLVAGSYLFDNSSDSALLLAIGLFIIVVLLLKVKRLHDINLAGWMALLTFVPILGQVITLVILLAPGTNGDNKYGTKPEKTGLGHKIFLCLIFFTAIIYIAGNYLGSWVKFEKWGEYHNKYYSIQLPGSYSVKNYEILGIPTEEVHLDTKHIIFNIGRFDFKDIKEKNKNYFIRSVGLVDSLENIFGINADNLVDILLPELKPDNLEIISDNINKNGSLSNRQIKAKLEINNAVAYLKLSVYLNKESDQLYIIYAIYDYESGFFGDSSIVAYYLDSFKLAH